MNNKGKTTNHKPSNVSIDSFKIRLPLDIVEIINPSLKSKWIMVNEDTGEVDPLTFKEKSLSFKDNGITTRFAIEKQVTRGGAVRDFVTILANSKLLKERYFSGINQDTIKLLYEGIISYSVINVSFDDFIYYAECTDVDFKKDINLPLHIYDSSLNECRNKSKPSKNKDKGYRYFNSETNKGIEWSTRKTTSYKSNPFLKIYHKQLELKNNSIDFANEYLKDEDYKDLARLETTVKNAAHFRLLGIKSSKLKDILNLDQETLNSIITKAVKTHLEPRVKPIKENNKLKPFELIIYASILLSMKGGVSYESYKTAVLNVLENKTERNRKRKVLDMIYTKFIQGSIEDKTSQEQDIFWRFLNWS